MKTIKDYTVHYIVMGSDHGELTVPAGTEVTHKTASGGDKNYHFVNDFSWVGPHRKGGSRHGLLHDLKYYGLNVPKEYVGT